MLHWLHMIWQGTPSAEHSGTSWPRYATALDDSTGYSLYWESRDLLVHTHLRSRHPARMPLHSMHGATWSVPALAPAALPEWHLHKILQNLLASTCLGSSFSTKGLQSKERTLRPTNYALHQLQPPSYVSLPTPATCTAPEHITACLSPSSTNRTSPFREFQDPMACTSFTSAVLQGLPKHGKLQECPSSHLLQLQLSCQGSICTKSPETFGLQPLQFYLSRHGILYPESLGTTLVHAHFMSGHHTRDAPAQCLGPSAYENHSSSQPAKVTKHIQST